MSLTPEQQATIQTYLAEENFNYVYDRDFLRTGVEFESAKQIDKSFEKLFDKHSKVIKAQCVPVMTNVNQYNIEK